MTPRERIQAAFSHQKPDRLPRYEALFPAFIDRWRRETGLPENADIYDHDRITLTDEVVKDTP